MSTSYSPELTRIVDRVYQKQLGRAANAGDYAWVQSFFKKIGTVSEVQLTNTIKESQEYKKKVDPEAFERNSKAASRDEYKGNQKALEMYDLSVKIKGKAPTVGELNNWVRYGSVKEWEASLRGEIKWQNVATKTGTQGIKYYSEEALDRLGGVLPKGTNKGGELIATPKSYKGPLSTDRLTEGQEVGDWIVMGQMGSERHGLVGKAFGSSVEKFMAKGGGAMGSIFFTGAGLVAMGQDSASNTILYGEEGMKQRRDLVKDVTGSDKRADRFLKYESRIEDIAAPIVDMIVFRGAPVVSSSRQVAKGAAAETLGQDVDWGNIALQAAVSWITWGVTKGLDKFAASKGWGAGYTSYGRPAAQVALGTAGGVVMGEKFDEALLKSTASAVSQQVLPKGTSPWVTHFVGTAASALADKGSRGIMLGKGGKEAQTWAILGATASYVAGAGVESYLAKPKTEKAPTGLPKAQKAADDILAPVSGQRSTTSRYVGEPSFRQELNVLSDQIAVTNRPAPTSRGFNHNVSDYIALGGVETEERLSPYAA